MSATTIRDKGDRKNRLAKHPAAQAIHGIPGRTTSFHGVTIIGVTAGGIDWGSGEVVVGAIPTTSGTASMTLVYANAAVEEDEYFKPEAAKRIPQLEAAGFDDDAPEGEAEFMAWLNNG